MNWIKSEKETTDKNLIRAARKMGYQIDQTGIIKRYVNEEGQWNSHLKNCKEYIQKSSLTKNKSSCAILGSGWLLDVPFEYLAENFSHLFLFDIFHPKPIEIRAKKYPNVHLVTEDLTGGAIKQIFDNRNKIIKQGSNWLNNLKLNNLFSYYGYDFVISLNILNQLDILITDYLKSKIYIDERDLRNCRRMIQSNHLFSLPVGRTCLITDRYECNIGENEKLENMINLIDISLDHLVDKSEWQWNFDTHKTYRKGYKTILKVIAGEL